MDSHDKLQGPFDTLHLFMHNWRPKKCRQSDREPDAQWHLLLSDDSEDARESTCATPTASTACESTLMKAVWTPSLETPKTGLGSIERRFQGVAVASPELITKTRHFTSDDGNDDLENVPALVNVSENYGPVGFTTGSGKKLKSPSKESIDRSRSILADSVDMVPFASGFTSASGKKLATPSDSALAKAKSVMDARAEECAKPKRESLNLAHVGELTPLLKTKWNVALRCPPCRDMELAILSGMYSLPYVPLISIRGARCNRAWDVGSAYEDLQGLKGVKRELVSFQWVQNHYRWIVWKCASLVRSFPRLLSSFTAEEVLLQLYQRYRVEIEHGKRSALRMIIERDDTASKPIVLIVARILKDKEIEISDGWYSMMAVLDAGLLALVEQGMLQEGVKIITCGAGLSSGEGIPALEAMNEGSSLRLYLHSNGTRRAPWHQRLGYYKNPILISLGSVVPHGGRICGVEVEVDRKYPACFIVDDGTDNKTIYTRREYERLVDRSEGSPSRLSRLNESRITSFARFRVKSRGAPAVAQFTVWHPENFDDLSEGDIIRVFGAATSEKSRRNSSELSISTSKGTIIFKVSSGKKCERIIHNALASTDNFPTELDFTGIVSSEPSEANSKSMSIFLADIHSRLLCVMMPRRYYASLFKIKPQQRLVLKDLQFLHFDQGKRFPVYSFTDRSDISLGH